MNARTKLIGTVVVGAALVVPVAQAQRPDDGAVHGIGAITATQSSASRPDDRAVHGTGSLVAKQQATVVPRPDDRAVHGLGSLVAPRHAAVVLRPDDRAEARGPGAIEASSTTAIRPDDRAEPRGPGSITTVEAVGSTSTGFDWNDAAIGGIGGAGMALLLTGCLFLFLGQRNRARLA